MNLKRVLKIFLVMVISVGMIGSVATSVSAISKPARVTGVKVTSATNSTISLKWSKAKGAKKYEIQYKLLTSKTWKSKKTSKKTIKLTGLKSNKVYNIRVRGLNGSIKGSFSKTKNQKTYIKPSSVKYNTIFAVKRDKSSIKLKWKEIPNTSYYEIYTLELNSGDSADIRDCDYEEYEENKYRPLPEYTSVIPMKQNTWYEFKIRSVNNNTGGFPALKSAWTEPFYACTLDGERVITGSEGDGNIVYELNDTFVIGADDVLAPRKIYERESSAEIYKYDSDIMHCNAITFPEKFTDIAYDMAYISSPDVLNGKTYAVGDDFEKDGKIQSIIVKPDSEKKDGLTVVIQISDHYAPSFSW